MFISLCSYFFASYPATTQSLCAMRSYNLLLPRLLIAEWLVESMAIPSWLSQSRISQTSEYPLKAVLYLSWAPLYTQMNSYVNTQMEDFLL